jgi:hypothetical protein
MIYHAVGNHEVNDLKKRAATGRSPQVSTTRAPIRRYYDQKFTILGFAPATEAAKVGYPVYRATYMQIAQILDQ